MRRVRGAENDFYPRPPRGGRPTTRRIFFPWQSFLSTPSARRATRHTDAALNLALNISIHALREEGDPGPSTARHRRRRFLSTPSARRATLPPRPRIAQIRNFYPRPPRGGRLEHSDGDPDWCGFLSTPSARRATPEAVNLLAVHDISIHALREEGDGLCQSHADLVDPISIHALREEGDRLP